MLNPIKLDGRTIDCMYVEKNTFKMKYYFFLVFDYVFDSRITADNYTFDTVKEFIYLGSAVTHQKLCQPGEQTKDHSCQQVLLWSQWAIE